jgi:hypothetical protein
MSIVDQFIHEYAALCRKFGMYVDCGANLEPRQGLAMPLDTPENEMETVEEHLQRIAAAENVDL